jgi:RNA polymerase sigma-70 factor (ECF subfamily)
VAPDSDELVRALYAQHAAPLLGYVLRLTGDRHQAEDVVQETLLRAWRHPEALSGDRGSPGPWLRTVARHLVVDAVRARRARPTEVGDRALQFLAVEDGTDEAVLAWEVTDALAGLSADHRRVLLETYVRGRSVADAARVLAVPVGTVKSRTHYALRALRLALEEKGVTP